MSTEDFWADLLRGEQTEVAETGAKSIGPLRLKDVLSPCTSKGCRVQTNITIKGVHYCTVHALDQLNLIFIRQSWISALEDCTCTAGKFSAFNRHTPDCALYSRIKNGTLTSGDAS